MKRKITLSLALALSIVLVSLMSSDSSVGAQSQIRVVADTGIVTLGANQKLRLSVAWDWDLNNDGVFIRFGQRKYVQGNCNDGVCKLTVASQTVSDPIALMPGEAVTLEVTDDNPLALGAIVLSSKQNVRVNALIVDTVTGEVVSVQQITFDDGTGPW